MIVLWVTLLAWAAFELALRLRDTARGRGRLGHDQWTRVMIAVAVAVAIAGALWLRAVTPSLRLPGPWWAPGTLVIWSGLAVRAWAVVSLGRSFRTTVEVDANQAVVTTGPYRWVRHPSYTGLLLIVAGLGLAVGDVASLALTVVLPVPAVLRRISVEETELVRVLGEPYAVYQEQTTRLVPQVW